MTKRAAVVLAAALAGCAAPHWHERQVVVLDGAGLADYDIRYERDDCLWQHRWPRRYDVDRGPYQLALTAPIRYRDEPAALELELRGDGAPTATVTGAEAVEDRLAPSGTRRYRLLPRSARLGITVRRDGRVIGEEALDLHTEQCRALLWREPPR